VGAIGRNWTRNWAHGRGLGTDKLDADQHPGKWARLIEGPWAGDLWAPVADLVEGGAQWVRMDLCQAPGWRAGGAIGLGARDWRDSWGGGRAGRVGVVHVARQKYDYISA